VLVKATEKPGYSNIERNNNCFKFIKAVPVKRILILKNEIYIPHHSFRDFLLFGIDISEKTKGFS